MKIAIINNLYKPYTRGGAERVIENITKELGKTGNEPLVISTRPHRKQLKTDNLQLTTFYPWNFISYYNLNRLPKFLRIFWHIINIFNIQSYLKIKKILKTEKPDVVMTHNLMGVGFLTPLAIKRSNLSGGRDWISNRKHIHTLHDIQLLHPSGLINVGEEKKVDSLFAKIYQSINKKLFSSVEVVISPSQWLLDQHIKKGFFKNAKKLVLQNPVSSAGQSTYRCSDQSKSDSFTFLYVGQIEKHKGIELLLRSFAQLKDSNIKLWIVGSGAYDLKLTTCNSDKIKFLGRKTPAEVKELMQQANCLVVPSLCYENSPTVIFEAEQNNLPIIGSNLGGISEILDSQFSFKTGDIDDLKNKMQWIMDNYEDVKNTTLAKNKINNYNVERYLDKILSL